MCQNIIPAIQLGSYHCAGTGGDCGGKLWKGLAASLHSSRHQPHAGDTVDRSSALKQGKRAKPQPWATTTQHLPPILLLEGPKDFCNGSAKHKQTRISPSSHQYPWEHPLCAHQHPKGHLTPTFWARAAPPLSARLCRFVFFYFEVSSCPSSACPTAAGQQQSLFAPGLHGRGLQAGCHAAATAALQPSALPALTPTKK